MCLTAGRISTRVVWSGRRCSARVSWRTSSARIKSWVWNSLCPRQVHRLFSAERRLLTLRGETPSGSIRPLCVLPVSAGPFPPGGTALSGSAVGLQRRGADSPLFLTRQKCLNHCRRQNFRRARLRPVPPLRQTPAGICRAAPPRPVSGPSPCPQTGHGCPGSAAFP